MSNQWIKRITNRLQTRLMLAFLAVLASTLLIIGVALLFVLRARPVPTDTLVNDMVVSSLSVSVRRQGDNNDERRTLRETLQQLQASIEKTGSTSGYRFMVVGGNGEDIIYDTAGDTDLDEIKLDNRQPLLPSRTQRFDIFNSGEVTIDGETWLYVARPIVNVDGIANRDIRIPAQLVTLTPAPQQTLARVLEDFGADFIVPLMQAGAVGFGVAFMLSVAVSRSVAHPLNKVASGAGEVAKGNYNVTVPVEGPHEAQVVAHAFNNMAKRVDATQQAQRDFLANVTHDLRTPLTSIQGFSQAIMDGVAAKPEAAIHAAEVIHTEAGRLTRMVSELLDLAKIQSEGLDFSMQSVDLEKLLSIVGESLEVKAREKDVALVVWMEKLRPVSASGDRLAQVFVNLVDNAIKHTQPGGKVWLVAKCTDDGILVHVQDNGEGIPDKDISRIFERFYQVDKSRSRDADGKSAGLGLAITKEIIVAHGGRIWAESQLGVGTRFNVWLPFMVPTYA